MALLSPPQISQDSTRIAISLIAVAASVALVYYGRDFFITLIVATLFAFILDPAVMLVMRLRIPRPAATGIVIGVAFVGIYLLSVLAWTQLLRLTDDLPVFTARLYELVDNVNGQLDAAEKKSIETLVPKSLREQDRQIQQKPQEVIKARKKRISVPAPPPTPPLVQEVRIHSDPKPVITTIYGYFARYFHGLVMASFVPFLVYFMLSWRDHIGKSFLGLFHGRDRYVVGKSWSGIGDSTRAYVLGNFFLWVFLSSASSIAFFFLRLPFWLLVGPVSSFLSLVPYVGLPLSIVPPILAALAAPTNLKIVLTIAAVTAALHIVAMNFMYPKVVGRRVRLNPLVVTVALMFWGGVWGGVGLILAVPITAAIKAVCDNVEALEPYGKLLGD